MDNFNQIFLGAFFIWVGVGFGWLLPKKFKMMKRIGTLNNDELIRLAKNGDFEAQRLKRQSTIFIVIGIIVLVPLRILSR